MIKFFVGLLFEKEGDNRIDEKRILIIEDNEDFRGPLEQTLRKAGYETQSIGEGSTALRLHQMESFDLVITDLMMPGKEGLETIVELHKFDPNLKILAISGGAQSSNKDCLPLAKKLGAVAALYKPFTAKEVLEIIANLLS